MNHLQGLLGNPAVNVLPFVVVFVDLGTDTDGLVNACGSQELHSDSAGLHSAGRIDTRADLEDDVIYGNMSRFKT